MSIITRQQPEQPLKLLITTAIMATIRAVGIVKSVVITLNFHFLQLVRMKIALFEIAILI